VQFLIDIAQKIHSELFEGEWFCGLKDLVAGTLNDLNPLLIPAIFAIFGIVFLLYGKKMMPLWKFLFMFSVGFIGAFVYIAPLLSFISIDAWIVGAIVGVLCGLLSRYLYLCVMIGACGFAGYFLTATFLVNIEVVNGLIAAVPAGIGIYVAYALVAGVCMLFVFPLLKWIEMATTSFGGACGIYFAAVAAFPAIKLSTLIALSSVKLDVLGNFFLPTEFFAADFIAVGALFLVGFITQITTRKQY